MCGFAGFFGGELIETDTGCSLLKKMTDPIARRGPDDDGYWHNRAARIGLGHRRLSIIDTSSAGHQPMHSASKRYVLVFNGEIYNHLEIRKKLELDNGGFEWRGHSDTETLLAGFDIWGIEKTVKQSIGMFALAVFDTKERKLILTRDRLGEKPLYYGWQRGASSATFIFGSELVSLRQHPAFDSAIDRGSIALLMRYNYIPAPYSIFQNIFKVLPGHICVVSLDRQEVDQFSYWSLSEVIHRADTNKYANNANEAIKDLEDILSSSVKQQMVADVPLGGFLSGGVDSSTIVSLMQAQSTRPIKTFSIGFNEEQYNEANHAKSVANYLGTDHTELYVTPEQSREVIPNLASLYNEPFADSSQIPTFLVSQLAKKSVTVSLSGDGGDELFCGYNRYIVANNIWRNSRRMPISARRAIALAITAFSPATLDKVLNPVQRVIPETWKLAHLGDKLHKGASALSALNADQLYLGLISQWQPESIVLNAEEPETILESSASDFINLDFISRMMALDTLSYMSDDILTKIDRAAMGVSLESRVPFLDHRVVEFAWSLPRNFKLNDGVGKWILRQVLYRHVPKSIIERPKMGFSIPIDDWLRGPLRDWAESLLSFQRIECEGYLNATVVRDRWEEHLSGKRNWSSHLWTVLMFQAWIEENNL